MPHTPFDPTKTVNERMAEQNVMDEELFNGVAELQEWWAHRSRIVLNANASPGVPAPPYTPTGLSMPVVAGETRRFFANVLWKGSDITGTTAGFTLNGPGDTGGVNSPELFAYLIEVAGGATIGRVWSGRYRNNAFGGTQFNGQQRHTLYHGIIRPVIDGVLTLEYFREVGSPGAPTVLAGSTLEYW